MINNFIIILLAPKRLFGRKMELVVNVYVMYDYLIILVKLE
jgi:hypothetical protein